MQLKNAIEAANPDIKVTGSEYPPTPERQFMATVISILQYVFMGLIIFGEQLFVFLGLPTEGIKKL